MNQKEVFLSMYNSLNDQQKQAVDTIEGPVMVIAGPGTGKTQILGARIGRILMDTDTQPGNILCLTYTDAGALAMRRRLTSFIGPESYKVNIYTFHAFCNDIIQENLFLFEKNSLEPISDLERIALLKELIDGFPKNHPLKRYRGDVYYEAQHLGKLFAAMKREGWSTEFLNPKLDEYIASLEHRKDEYVAKRAVGIYKKGDLRKDKIEEETRKIERLRAAINEFDRFQLLMRSRNRYDFDDMINWVIKAFSENESLLRRYQEQFLYILVDEFQDTSGSQNKLVQLLINYWDKPNVFVVGDDDQSIFRFQGANVENMEEFRNSYAHDLFTVVLTNNYRSTQPILDVSKSLIDKNQVRLINKIKNLSKELIASNPKVKDNLNPPLIREYETQREEMIGICLEVEKLLQQEVPPGKIAIIYKENKFGEEMSEFLHLRQIPAYSKRNRNILEIPLAAKLIRILRYLATEHDIPYSGSEMLFEILHFDWFGIPPIEIAKASVAVADKQYSDKKTSLRRWLFEKSQEPPRDLFALPMNNNLANATRILEDLIGQVPNVTLQGLVDLVIRKTGILKKMMLSADKLWQLQVVTGFFDFIKDETRRNPGLTLQQLIDLLDLMEKEEIALPLTQVSGSDKAVNLLTVHGSKGLEFTYVFVAGSNSTFWEKKKKQTENFKLPEAVFSSQHSSEAGEELRRLFYVALTRAESLLTISYSRYNNNGREMEPSVFVEEVRQSSELPVEKVFIDPVVIGEFQAMRWQNGFLPKIEKLEKEFVGGLLDRFVMNVTALNNYLKCPLEFYFKNLVRVPSPKNEAIEFGSAVHYALEQLFRNMQNQGDKFPSPEVFVGYFDFYMGKHRESFTPEQFKRRIEYGHIILPAYYNNGIGSWSRIVAIERTIKNVVLNGVPLKGKLDKLEFDGKIVNIVDYKTGDPEKAKAKLKGPSDADPNGGDYWRQAVFYKILIDHHDQKGWKALSTEFDFIEPDNKAKYQKVKLLISEQDIGIVTAQITDIWNKIQNHAFYTGCGKEDCHWCNFVKTNELAVQSQEEEE